MKHSEYMNFFNSNHLIDDIYEEWRLRYIVAKFKVTKLFPKPVIWKVVQVKVISLKRKEKN